MAQNDHMNDYNYIINLFKKAENNLNNEGWFAKRHGMICAMHLSHINST